LIASRHQTVRRLALTLGSAAALVSGWLHAQPPAATPPVTPYINRNIIVLDPAHGGEDNGATLNSQQEKNITLALSSNLKTLLTARGFTVVTTRDAELPATAPLLTSDQRAGIANHVRPAACILLHATATGSGVHLFTSALEPSLVPYEPSTAVLWETAQTFYLPQSRRLANDLGLALLRAKIPILLTRTSVRPLDNLTCPAIAVEVAPLAKAGQKPTPSTDTFYQQRIADTLASAIQTWRDTALPRPAPKPATGVTP
jgi:N-acetylmuramoyl-L-alanine amidase